jgi:DNA-binding GntR family transcriptional regulator
MAATRSSRSAPLPESARAKPIRARGLVAQVADEVRSRLAGNTFAPGAPVSIASLVAELGVSHTPVREALARLAAEGLLRFEDNLGYSVPPLPTARDYTDWAVARLVIECNSLLYILGPLDARLIDEAEAINTRIAETDFGSDAEGVRAYSEANWAFHAKLIGLARNPLLEDAHARLYRAPQFSRIFLGRGILNQKRVVAEHRTILRQLRRGERAAAAAALRRHIVDSLERDARLAHAVVSLKRLTQLAG